MKPGLIRSLMFAALAAGYSSQSNASGFALIENSASGQGNAYAGAAAIAEDASTVWFNPAGMTLLENDQVVVVGHFIKPDSEFSDTGSTAAALLGNPELMGHDDDGGFNAMVANFYYVTALDENLKFGFGMTTPFGLATRYEDNWVGRYHGVETDLKTINFNPSIAYKLNDDLSIGAGINIMLADITFTSAVDFGAICVASFNAATCAALGSLPQQADGFADLRADNFNDLALGVNFGLLYKISDDTRLGVAYRSEVTIDVEGDADFSVPAAASFVVAQGVFVDTGLNASVTLPQSLSMSVVHDMDELTLLADITWTGWSSFDELRIRYDNALQPDSVTTEAWDDTLRYSFGADYQYSDALTLRAGWAYDETPVPDAEHRTVRVPGNSRRWLSFGGTYIIDKEFTVDVGYSHLFISDTAINNSVESGIPTLASTLTGTYEASVDILSAQLRWNY
ncbi:MAG: outer membrane protein transport protein [Gammaproteobacteria bacterium]|nr:outer membrane protein transport protein [Gammaproteobacteria bacterium]